VLQPPSARGIVTVTTHAGHSIQCRVISPDKRAYFGGRSSPLSQPIHFSVVSGSGSSQSKHWKVRWPLPPGGSAEVR